MGAMKPCPAIDVSCKLGKETLEAGVVQLSRVAA